MASRPSRTAHKRYINVTRALMKDIAVVFVAGKNDGQVLPWNTRLNRPERVTAALAGALADGVYPWQVHCVVTTRERCGTENALVYDVPAPHPVRQSQIALGLNEIHKDMLSDVDADIRLTAAWVAVTTGEPMEAEQLKGILTKCGAYDFAAAWEER